MKVEKRLNEMFYDFETNMTDKQKDTILNFAKKNGLDAVIQCNKDGIKLCAENIEVISENYGIVYEFLTNENIKFSVVFNISLKMSTESNDVLDYLTTFVSSPVEELELTCLQVKFLSENKKDCFLIDMRATGMSTMSMDITDVLKSKDVDLHKISREMMDMGQKVANCKKEKE